MSLGFSIKVNTKQAIRELRRLGKAVEPGVLLSAIGNRHLKWINDNLKKGGLTKLHEAMAATTISEGKSRTSSRSFQSTFRSQLSSSFVVRRGAGQVWVGTRHQLSEIHHFGTKPFTIEPTNKTFLKFKTPEGDVFRKKVSHPGIPARPLIPTKAVAETLALGVIKAAVDRAIREGKGGR